ncbi:uncharacterized protein TNCV_1148631 [Trichonephila clavipes]|nr:uncharacterized protein TNCV_1148631 [Trichonephila clavipes]
MDVRKCIVPSQHGSTLNSRRATSPLVKLGEGGDKWEAPDHPQGVLPQNWGETELSHSVTCMVLKAMANDRRHLALCHDDFLEVLHQILPKSSIRKVQQEFVEDAIGFTQVKKGINRFKNGSTSVESDQHSCRSQNTLNAVVKKVENLIMKEYCLIVRGTVEQIEISASSAHAILWHHGQSDCEICSQASVGRTERIPTCSFTGPAGHSQC